MNAIRKVVVAASLIQFDVSKGGKEVSDISVIKDFMKAMGWKGTPQLDFGGVWLIPVPSAVINQLKTDGVINFEKDGVRVEAEWPF
jgi:hypothetical protein